MSEHPEPVAINLHQKSRLLAMEFSDGKRFELPCEYLRVFSRAKEVRTMDSPPVGKEQVNIERIEPQGQYAIKLVFDDGHDTGIYSWETLYELGEKHQQNWDAYLKRLEELGVERKDPDGEQKRRIKVLYFTYFVRKLGKEAEEIELPPAVRTVEKLIELQRRRRPPQAHLFKDGTFRVTVNKQFCEPFTLLEDGDEVAFVPNSPHAPVAE